MSARRQGIRIWVLALSFLALALVMDTFYFGYMTSHGLESKAETVQIWSARVQFPIAALAVIGVAVASVTIGVYVGASIYAGRAKEEAQLERLLVLRVVTIAFAAFSAVLFLPYVLGSNWSWRIAVTLAGRFPQLRDPGQSFFDWAGGLMVLDDLWKYALSQNLATAVLAGVSVFLVRRPRKIRRLR